MTVTDSLENIDQEYVLVPGPPIDVSSSVGASRPSHTQYRSGSLPQESSSAITRPSAPMPIVGAHTNSMYQVGSSGSQDSAPGTSLGSMDISDEQPSAHCMTRVKSLQQCASAITELVNEKVNVAESLLTTVILYDVVWLLVFLQTINFVPKLLHSGDTNLLVYSLH